MELGASLARRVWNMVFSHDEDEDTPNNEQEEDATLEYYETRLQKTLKIKALFNKHAIRDVVSIDTIPSLLMKLGIQDTGIIDYMCRHYDQAYTGEYNYVEFFSFMHMIGTIHREFISADKNKDETISLSEIRSVLNHLDISLGDPIIKRIIEIFDINNDKLINYGEFFLMYIFLTELKKSFDTFQTNRLIAGDQLCRLLDDHKKEEEAAQYLNMIFGPLAFDLSIDAFTRVAVYYKDKVKPLKRRAKALSKPHFRMKVEPRLSSSEDILPERLKDQIIWLRPNQIHPDCKLFVHGIDESDVIQGDLLDCWFLGALSVLAAWSPDSIRNLFVFEDSENGVYRCKFYKHGEWVEVEVDDTLPCCKPADVQPSEWHRVVPVLYFASCLDRSEFWVPIIEKAYAKLHGSYDALKHGDIAEALKDLTGGATQTLIISNSLDDMDAQWTLLSSLYNERCLMGCAIDSDSHPPSHKDDIKRDGLLEFHAYSILKCQEVDGVRFLQLRNPWGKKEWNGDWSDSSSKWDDKWKKKNFLKYYTFADDGKFHMCFEDFVKYFNRVYVLHRQFNEPKCIAHGKWEQGTAEGCHNHPYWFRNPRYAIKTTEPDTSVIVNLTQYDLRYKHSLNLEQSRTEGNYNNIGLYLLAKTNADYATMQVDDIVKRTEFTNTRDTSLEFHIESPTVHVLLPCTFEANMESSFIISVYSNKSVEVEEIRNGRAHSVFGYWKQAAPIVTESMRGNIMREVVHGPMYWLACSQTGNVDLLLVPKWKGEFMVLGIKIFESSGNNQFKRVLREKFDGRSMCVSLTLRENVDYIVELISYTPIEADTNFELVVFSDHVSRLIKYATHSHESGACSLTSSGTCGLT